MTGFINWNNCFRAIYRLILIAVKKELPSILKYLFEVFSEIREKWTSCNDNNHTDVRHGQCVNCQVISVLTVRKQCLQAAVTFLAHENFRDTLACMFLFSSMLTARTLECLWGTKRLQLWRPITGLSAKFYTSPWHFVISFPCSIWDITKQSPVPCSRPHLEFYSWWLFSSELAKTIIMVLESSWSRKKNECYDDVRAPKFINPSVLILLILWNVVRSPSPFC